MDFAIRSPHKRLLVDVFVDHKSTWRRNGEMGLKHGALNHFSRGRLDDVLVLELVAPRFYLVDGRAAVGAATFTNAAIGGTETVQIALGFHLTLKAMTAELAATLRKSPNKTGGSMTGRNRSEGWTHAKLTGHALEQQIAETLESNAALSSALHLDCFGLPETSVAHVAAGGIGASHGRCVLGGVTPPKTDLVVRWRTGRTARISLKMSAGGQVWLVTPERFIAGFEAQFGVRVPDAVRTGIRFFIGPLSSKEMRDALGGNLPLGPMRSKDGKSQELHQERFVAETLAAIIPNEWNATLAWMRQELPRIAELCFSRGLCADPDAQAEFVWYYIRNEASGEVLESRVIPLASIVAAISKMPLNARAAAGPRNGGSTVTLPFGFLQMHRPAGGNQVQFHHGISAIKATLGL